MEGTLAPDPAGSQLSNLSPARPKETESPLFGIHLAMEHHANCHGIHSRRGFLEFAAGSSLLATLATPSLFALQPENTPQDSGWPGFPLQDPALVRAIVGASHGNLKKVTELVEAHPALANAAIDWSYGDWETALGAASHVGNREIAELLISKGARPDIFAMAMLGWNDAVKTILGKQPSLAAIRGPHGIPLVAHAAAGKNPELAAYIEAIEGANPPVNPTLSPDEMAVYLGEYTITDETAGTGTAAIQRSMVVTTTRFGMAIKAGTGPDRTLFQTAPHTFYPVGAPNVRVTFKVTDSKAHTLEVAESPWLVTASRNEASKP